MLKRVFTALLLIGTITFLRAASFGQAVPHAGATLVIFPFDNASGAPGLAWISEASPEILAQRLTSPTIYVATREDRVRAFDRVGIPVGLHPSRATMYRIAEQLDVDYAVFGEYNYDGRALTASGQLVDMRREKLLPRSSTSGFLPDLIRIETAVAWNLLHQLRPNLSLTRENFIAGFPSVRLDAFEQYVRGITSSTPAEKIDHFREAVRMDPAYTDVWLQLGKTYFEQRQYGSAISALGRIPERCVCAREANFYSGLAAYYQGDFANAETAFNFVSVRLPLPEVSNNLGVVSARRGKRNALELFQRAVQFDPADPDYHFNLALAMYRAGDTSAAARQLRETLTLRPSDTEARSLYERIAPATSARALTPSTAVINASARLPLERIKRNYDENSFRQLSLQIDSTAEQRLAKSDPRSHAHYHLERGEELLMHGFALEAEKEFREAISLNPAELQAHLGLARVLDNNGDIGGARSEVQTALQFRESPDLWLFLARLDLRENRTETAAENVNKALQLDPGNAAAQELRRAVAAKLAEKAQPLPNP